MPQHFRVGHEQDNMDAGRVAYASPNVRGTRDIYPGNSEVKCK